MKVKFISAILFLLLLSISVFGQTASDFEKKYGSRIYYEIRPQVLMSAEFDKNGQVFRAVLQPNRYSNNTVYSGNNYLKGKDIESIFDELVPVKIRGNKTKFWGITLLLGQVYQTNYNYENVGITLYGAIKFGKSKASSNSNHDEEANIDDNDGKIQSGEVAEISWAKRECIKK